MENKQQPRVINKSGTTKLADEVVAAKEAQAGKDFQNRRRDNRRNRRAMEDQAPKEFDTINISINRVSRTVKGGRRMRFQALVAMGNHKNKIGVGLAKGADVTTAVQKAEQRAKKNMIEVNLNGETICHEVETKVTGAQVLMKPAAPGTGIIAGGVVRSVIGLTGIKNLISKSIGSTNKTNIAYAVLEGLRQQVPRKDWLNAPQAEAKKSAKKEDKS
ncbi:MAG: 30S ribosomal protein S5 [Candidatus Nomurabacteria bacterium]|jgi:small subunit ribosomal protein S5|nr:30S ribosomal protein S5 [Candidatus Nomurabacteria bacterium]